MDGPSPKAPPFADEDIYLLIRICLLRRSWWHACAGGVGKRTFIECRSESVGGFTLCLQIGCVISKGRTSAFGNLKEFKLLF